MEKVKVSLALLAAVFAIVLVKQPSIFNAFKK